MLFVVNRLVWIINKLKNRQIQIIKNVRYNFLTQNECGKCIFYHSKNLSKIIFFTQTLIFINKIDIFTQKLIFIKKIDKCTQKSILCQK